MKDPHTSHLTMSTHLRALRIGMLGPALQSGGVVWDLVAGLIADSYCMTAPKRLVDTIESAPGNN